MLELEEQPTDAHPCRSGTSGILGPWGWLHSDCWSGRAARPELVQAASGCPGGTRRSARLPPRSLKFFAPALCPQVPAVRPRGRLCRGPVGAITPPLRAAPGHGHGPATRLQPGVLVSRQWGGGGTWFCRSNSFNSFFKVTFSQF